MGMNEVEKRTIFQVTTLHPSIQRTVAAERHPKFALVEIDVNFFGDTVRYFSYLQMEA